MIFMLDSINGVSLYAALPDAALVMHSSLLIIKHHGLEVYLTVQDSVRVCA